MKRLLRLSRSSVGCKMLMAVTGVGLLLFVMGHLFGNLKIFQGQDAYNDYAEFLHSMPMPLWAARVGLLAVFMVHIGAAFRLHAQNRAARPVRYADEATVQASFASRHMLLSGIVVLLFVVYHLLHFTFGVIETGEMHGVEAGRHDVYRAVVTSFQHLWVVISYLAAMVVLGLHLIHATSSIFQTVGLKHVAMNGSIHLLAIVLTLVLVLGNCAIPLACYFVPDAFPIVGGD